MTEEALQDKIESLRAQANNALRVHYQALGALAFAEQLLKDLQNG